MFRNTAHDFDPNSVFRLWDARKRSVCAVFRHLLIDVSYPLSEDRHREAPGIPLGIIYVTPRP